VAVSDFVAPTVVATALSAGAAWLVAKATAKSAIKTAEIGASVERDKLAHTREQFRATRRDLALDDLGDLDERMWSVTNPLVSTEVRLKAAQEAHSLLLRVVMVLSDEAVAGRNVNELLSALQEARLEHAARLWPGVLEAITASRLE
jgi:hypothetical protein